MNTYSIINLSSGADLGKYQGHTMTDAYLAMLVDANAFDASAAKLRDEAAKAGDLDMVSVCDIALGDHEGSFDIDTAKGSFVGTLREVCAWQAEMQGDMATIDSMDVDANDFDPDDLDGTIARVVATARYIAADAILNGADEIKVSIVA